MKIPRRRLSIISPSSKTRESRGGWHPRSVLLLVVCGTITNRIDPALFSGGFASWVRETWPDHPKHLAIDTQRAGEPAMLLCLCPQRELAK
jgi:hypothetical protein